MSPALDVFTVDEIARAAGVPRASVQKLVDSGDLRPLAGTRFFRGADAVRAGRQARSVSVEAAFASPDSAPTDRGLPALASSLIHGTILAALVWSTSGIAETARPRSAPRMVFLAGPGPGGGGGGAGRAPRAEVRRIARPRPTPSEPAAVEPPPLPSRVLVAPVAITAGESQPASADEDGIGSGTGPGLDEGSGGGAGGGPFRPGGGIEPPRLMREVKALYTDEARRRGVTGAVILEIVIRKDGTVGDVQVLRGLGAGLDERAVRAVRDWRFAPARRMGEPVDVVVEVEVEFSLR